MTTRRRVLLAAVAALGVACGASLGAPKLLARTRAGKPGRDRLLAALGLDGIALSALVNHARTREQLAAVLRACGPRARTLRQFSTDYELRATLRRWIAEDFENGALVEVDGWQLASSEALVLALLANPRV